MRYKSLLCIAAGYLLLFAIEARTLGQEMTRNVHGVLKVVDNENNFFEAAARIQNDITILMCGDVMTGRGIDQILPHPGDPTICESYMKSAQGHVKIAGAGRNLVEAQIPAIKKVSSKGRVILFAFGLGTSGIPSDWAASDEKPGVNLLKNLGAKSLRDIQDKVRRVKHKGDIVVASIHWGSNWGYEIPREQTIFAHRLIDEAGVDIIHGHSSHHAKAIEIYKDKLILYGCGDFLNDYEGIGGYEEFRADLSLMYFATVDSSTGKLLELLMTPTQIRRFKSLLLLRISSPNS